MRVLTTPSDGIFRPSKSSTALVIGGDVRVATIATSVPSIKNRSGAITAKSSMAFNTCSWSSIFLEMPSRRMYRSPRLYSTLLEESDDSKRTNWLAPPSSTSLNASILRNHAKSRSSGTCSASATRRIGPSLSSSILSNGCDSTSTSSIESIAILRLSSTPVTGSSISSSCMLSRMAARPPMTSK